MSRTHAHLQTHTHTHTHTQIHPHTLKYTNHTHHIHTRTHARVRAHAHAHRPGRCSLCSCDQRTQLYAVLHLSVPGKCQLLDLALPRAAQLVGSSKVCVYFCHKKASDKTDSQNWRLDSRWTHNSNVIES